MDLKTLSVCRIILLNRLILLFAFLLVASALPAAAQQPFADLYYFTGTPPMTRLNEAKVRVVLDFTPQELHFGIEKKGNELTAQEAEEGLGVPEIFDGAPFCSKEQLTDLGLCESAKGVVRTHRFNFFTRDKRHYSLLFLGTGDNFKYWRLLPDKSSASTDLHQTDWTPMAGSASFIEVQRVSHSKNKNEVSLRLKPIVPKYSTLDDFLRGRTIRYSGIDLPDGFNRR